MDAVVITLTRFPNRLAKMADQLRALGQPFIAFYGTDGLTLSETERHRVDTWQRRWISEYPLTDNEIGCFLSHLRALQLLLDSQADMLAVLEDDLVISSDLPSVLCAIESLDIDFDIIDLHRKFRRGEFFIPCADLLPDAQIGLIGYTHMGTLGYVVSRNGARRFLSRARRFVHAVDKAMHRYWANGLQIYGMSRPMVEEDKSIPSIIDATRTARCMFPDARALRWRLARTISKSIDGVRKRCYFPIYSLSARRRFTRLDSHGSSNSGQQGHK